jgi:hypothetical protein
MKSALTKIGLVLPWILLIWAVAACISISQAYRQQSRKTYHTTNPQEKLVITLRSDGGGQNDFTYKGNEDADDDFLISKVVPIMMSLIGVGILVFQVVINNGQLKTQRAELRPYVSFEIDFMEPVPDRETPFVFSLINHGKTPALDIAFRGGIWCIPWKDMTSSLPEIAPGFDEQRANLFPSENMKERELEFPANTGSRFTAQQIQLTRWRVQVFIYALKVRYRDLFGQWHETQEYWHFCIDHTQPGHIHPHIGLIPGKSIIT